MRIAIAILLIAALAQAEWSFSITASSVCDSLIEQELIIGTNDECTPGFDLGWDVMRPPFPPTGALAYLFISDPANPGIDGLLSDFRSDSEIHLLWRIHYYTNLCGTIGDSCMLSWNPDSLPEGTFKIVPSLEDTGWRAPAIDWSEALDMSAHSSLPPFWVSHMAYISYTSPLQISEEALPEEISLCAYPNPFNSAVSIAVDFPSSQYWNSSDLKIEIFDISGRRLEAAEPLDAMPEESRYDSSKRRSSIKPNSAVIYVWCPEESLPSGIYLVRAVFGDSDVSQSQRILYLK